MRDHHTRGRFGALLLVGALVAVVCFAAAPASANEHTKDNAVNVTEEANFTVTFPFQTDHYPGDQNQENGSIQYVFSPEDSFEKLGLNGQGAFGDYLIIDANWIDYSACEVDNTAVFGIDRGNNNSGTKIDQDLVSKQKNADFRDDGITIEFYDWGDFANDPPYMAAEDAIIAEQGARSSAGACLTVTNEPGWYRITGFLNGTAADNGPDQRPSEDAKQVAGMALSNYIYVCECDSEQEAREQLGAPPNERTTTDSTPTPTATATATATPEPEPETATPVPSTATAAPTEAATPTATPADSDDESPTPTATAAGGSDGPTGGSNSNSVGTPTPAEGPGFGALLALLALLTGGLLVRRP
jgi:PGF-CTERM protein